MVLGKGGGFEVDFLEVGGEFGFEAGAGGGGVVGVRVEEGDWAWGLLEFH